MHAFALLGSHPTLSLAEIAVVTGQSPSFLYHDIALYDHLADNLPVLCERLGGTQKIGVIIGSVPTWDHDEIATFLASDLLQEVEGSNRKIVFGISVYAGGDDQKRLRHIQTATQSLGIEIKNILKRDSKNARYVIAKTPTLSSVVVRKNHLLEHGAEYVFLVKNDEILIGKTVAVQNVDAWSARDFGRPRRNAKQGMLPPKLARIMINLSGKDLATSRMLDPFCGSGTLLMEAALLGAQTVIGSDIHTEAINDTQENLRWLSQYTHLTLPPYTLFSQSAQTVASEITPQSIDVLITETYLGRPRQGNETLKEIDDALAYVAHLYQESFAALAPLLKSGAVLVIAAPVHYENHRAIAFDVRTLLEPLGYTYYPLPFEPIFYHHQDQLVGRRLWRFIKN